MGKCDSNNTSQVIRLQACGIRHRLFKYTENPYQHISLHGDALTFYAVYLSQACNLIALSL